MTAINDVRHLAGGGVVAAHGCRPGLAIESPPVPWGPSGALHTGSGGGFVLHEAFRGCVAGVSEPHVVQFPPSGGTPSAALVGVAPTVQTTLANTSDNELLSARWSALRGQQCLSWRTARTRTPEHAREPLDTHVNPLIRTSTP